MADLLTPKSPALPLAPNGYNVPYQNRYSSVLRLYFNQLDNMNSSLLGPLGMQYLDAPHIGACNTANQYATANDTPELVEWNTAVSVKGFTLNANNTATVSISGIYKIDFRLQFVNTDNAPQDAVVWLQVNGSQIDNSTSIFTLQARRSAGVPTFLTAYSSVLFEAEEGDAIGLWWATDQAFISGTQDGIYISAQAAQTTPYIRPAKPSSSGSITFLGRI